MSHFSYWLINSVHLPWCLVKLCKLSFYMTMQCSALKLCVSYSLGRHNLWLFPSLFWPYHILSTNVCQKTAKEYIFLHICCILSLSSVPSSLPVSSLCGPVNEVHSHAGGRVYTPQPRSISFYQRLIFSVMIFLQFWWRQTSIRFVSRCPYRICHRCGTGFANSVSAVRECRVLGGGGRSSDTSLATQCAGGEEWEN